MLNGGVPNFGCTRLRGRMGTERSEIRVLRRFWKGFWRRVLRRALGFTAKKGFEKGSQKGF